MQRRFETYEDSELFQMQWVFISIEFEGEHAASYSKANHDWYAAYEDSIDPRGDFAINCSELLQIKTLENFIKAFNERRIFRLEESQLLDVEKGIHELYKHHGGSFEVDPDEAWYAFSDGTGISGTVANVYLELYKRDIVERAIFLEEINMLLEYGAPLKIYVGIESDDYDFENRVTYEIELGTGKVTDITERDEEEIKYVPGIDYETARPENE